MRIRITIALILFAVACNKNKKAEEMGAFYRDNQDSLNVIKDLLLDERFRYSTFYLDGEEIEGWAKDGDHIRSEKVPARRLGRLFPLLTSLNIYGVKVGGGQILMLIEDISQDFPCYNLIYVAGDRKLDWGLHFILDEHWYFKKEACF